MKYAFDKVMFEDLDKLNFEEKLELFTSIWEKHDPSPYSPGNGFRDGYYRRVRFANEEFTQYKDGWKTDRGMIYILFGPPNQVFYSDFSSFEKATQQWVYYTNGVFFTFFDDHNTGDFQLKEPYDYEPFTKPIK
ncbi:GWxTD domain-containing protein [candidate division KSB1 bacterium]|nr:GWxTD domain-containing protein [candidate division KSB1 bacterium]